MISNLTGITHARASAIEQMRLLIPPQIVLKNPFFVENQETVLRPNTVPSKPEITQVDLSADLHNSLHDLSKLKIRIIKNILINDPNFILSKQAKVLIKAVSNTKKNTAEANIIRIAKINEVLADDLKLPTVIKDSEELKNNLHDFAVFLLDMFSDNKMQVRLQKCSSEKHYLLLRGCNLIEKELSTALSERDMFSSAENFTETLSKVAKKIRELTIHYANNAEDPSWISPTYFASQQHQRSQLQHPQQAVDDYTRFNFHELMFLADRLSGLMFNGKTLIVSSGMEAFNMILEYESERSKTQPGKILIFDDIYFELNYQFERFITDKDCKMISSTLTPEIEAALHQELPVTIFTAPMTNSMTRRVVDVENIIKTISDSEFIETWKEKNGQDAKLDLIIDNTTTSLLLDWKRLAIKELPEHIRVIGFESLVKYPGEGKELAAGGMISTNNDEIYEAFSELRLLRGSTPTRHEVAKLDFIGNPERIQERLARHSRNTDILTKVLLNDIDQGLGIFEEVIHAFRENHPDLGTAIETLSGPGSLLSLVPIKYEDLSSKELLEVFTRTAIALAANAKIDLHCGTSFGFDTSRFSIYAQEYHPDGGDVKYIRFATGMEDHDRMLAVSHIIAHASRLTEIYFDKMGKNPIVSA